MKNKKGEKYDLAILMPKDAAENVTKRRRRKGTRRHQSFSDRWE